MKIKKYIISVFSSLLLMSAVLLITSCEEIVDDPGLPYKEELVVHALLLAGEPVKNITITRTLHPLEVYDREKAQVRDANAYIESAGKKYPLVFDGTYSYSVADLIPEAGKKYNLFVKWHDLNANSTTVVPHEIAFDSISYKFTRNNDSYSGSYWIVSAYAIVKPSDKAVYFGSQSYGGDYYKFHTDRLTRYVDTLSSGYMQLHLVSYSVQDTTNFKSLFEGYGVVAAIDYPYYYFDQSINQGNQDFDIFGSSGTNVKGNINGGLGIFVGASIATKQFFDE